MSDIPIRCPHCGVIRWMSREWCHTVAGCVVKCPDCGGTIDPVISTPTINQQMLDEGMAKEYHP